MDFTRVHFGNSWACFWRAVPAESGVSAEPSEPLSQVEEEAEEEELWEDAFPLQQASRRTF